MALKPVGYLDAVLELSQKSVCLAEPPALTFPQKAELAQAAYGPEGAPLPQARLHAPIGHLEGLHDELHLPYASFSELYVPQGVPPLEEAPVYPLLHGPYFTQSREVQVLSVDKGLDHPDEALPQPLASGRGPHLYHGLPLPGLPPGLIVDLVASELSE